MLGVLLGGHSFGGVVAFEMAIQLQKQGHEVALVAIIDAIAPIVDNKPNCSDEEEAANLSDFASYIEHMFSLNLEVSKETHACLSIHYYECIRLLRILGRTHIILASSLCNCISSIRVLHRSQRTLSASREKHC